MARTIRYEYERYEKITDRAERRDNRNVERTLNNIRGIDPRDLDFSGDDYDFEEIGR